MANSVCEAAANPITANSRGTSAVDSARACKLLVAFGGGKSGPLSSSGKPAAPAAAAPLRCARLALPEPAPLWLLTAAVWLVPALALRILMLTSTIYLLTHGA